MKLKKSLAGILITLIFILQITIISFNNFVNAETNRRYEISIVPSNENIDLGKLEPGNEFELNVNIGNLENIGEGIVALMGQLEYDVNILERLEVSGQNGWRLDDADINQANLKFITDNNNKINQPGTIFKSKFKVKETVTEPVQNSVIKIKNISASGGYGIIRADDTQIEFSVKMPDPVEDKIESNKYVISDTDKEISRIEAGTTVAKFKENVVATPNIVIINKEGNILKDTDIIATGMTVKVGESLQYTAIVTGDIDGLDGIITTNDLAQIKLHLIEYEALEGINLKAADLDNDKEITINDVAQIKMVLIDLNVAK